MRPEDFARELSPWLHIDTVLTVGNAHERGFDSCEERDVLVLHHPDIASGREGNIVGLVETFLEHFHIPSPWLSSVRSMASPSLLADETWEWLGELRFTGEVELDADVERIAVPVSLAHVLVHDSWAVTEILMQPLTMLFACAAQCLQTWRSVTDKIPPDNFYLRARDDGALVVHIDGWVAEALGVPEPVAAGRVAGGMKAGYRSVTVIDTFGELKSQPLQIVAAEALKSLAAELATT